MSGERSGEKEGERNRDKAEQTASVCIEDERAVCLPQPCPPLQMTTSAEASILSSAETLFNGSDDAANFNQSASIGSRDSKGSTSIDLDLLAEAWIEAAGSGLSLSARLRKKISL